MPLIYDLVDHEHARELCRIGDFLDQMPEASASRVRRVLALPSSVLPRHEWIRDGHTATKDSPVTRSPAQFTDTGS